jgi:hypothetical protein
MAGRPKTRAKKIARGECVCPAHDCPIHKTELARATATDSLPSPGSVEWQQMLERARAEVALMPAPQSVDEEREQILDRSLIKAYRVLEEQLDDEDARVRQKAAIEIIERVKGKAPQTVRTVGEQVHTVRYESAAWTWGKEVAEREMLEGEVLHEEEVA